MQKNMVLNGLFQPDHIFCIAYNMNFKLNALRAFSCTRSPRQNLYFFLFVDQGSVKTYTCQYGGIKPPQLKYQVKTYLMHENFPENN